MNHTDTPLIIEKTKTVDNYLDVPDLDVPDLSFDDFIDVEMIREGSINLPSIAEPGVVRHFINLSIKNHHIDKDFYPLGSCTMKYNPKINDKVASLDNFTQIHPDQHESTIQGYLKILYDLENMLNSITGMHRTTLQPAAGSQGELVGLLIMQKYHKLNKNKNKKFIIVPETAHGTNPASVILAGFEVLEVGTSNFGTIDMEDLRSKLTDEVAGIMLTQPNTLGVFEKDIKEISRLIHGVDGLLYMDGANLNAMVGLCKPSDMGFDIIHMNLHKTFSTPHGGGGPGAGPIGVTKKLKDFLPSPIINKNANNSYYLDYSSHHSIGKIHSFYGNVGVLLRAYCYIKSYGDNLKDISKNAIINANYIKKNLSEYYNIPFYDGTMHEFVISALNQKKRGLKALDIAKVLLDYGFHAPTIYFPINVQEAIMIEPTETESKEKLDEFIKFMIYIDQNLDSNLEDFLTCPKNTPVKRVNEVKANRDLDLSWNNEI